jgi:hypothetical protein
MQQTMAGAARKRQRHALPHRIIERRRVVAR